MLFNAARIKVISMIRVNAFLIVLTSFVLELEHGLYKWKCRLYTWKWISAWPSSCLDWNSLVSSFSSSLKSHSCTPTVQLNGKYFFTWVLPHMKKYFSFSMQGSRSWTRKSHLGAWTKTYLKMKITDLISYLIYPSKWSYLWEGPSEKFLWDYTGLITVIQGDRYRLNLVIIHPNPCRALCDIWVLKQGAIELNWLLLRSSCLAY